MNYKKARRTYDVWMGAGEIFLDILIEELRKGITVADNIKTLFDEGRETKMVGYPLLREDWPQNSPLPWLSFVRELEAVPEVVVYKYRLLEQGNVPENVAGLVFWFNDAQCTENAHAILSALSYAEAKKEKKKAVKH